MTTRNDNRLFQTSLVSVFALAICTAAAAQITATHPPNPNIAPPGAQRPQPPQPQQQVPGTRAPQPILQTPSRGTVEGFVYWDANKVVHKPASSCSGLAITVSAGSSSGGPLTSYTALATISNNFKYVGQVKQFLSGGKVNLYDVCTYGYGHVPVGPSLQVKLTVTDPFAFSPYVVPQSAILGPIQIINSQCNMLPQIVSPTSSDLFAHWSTCQNMAYDVNFPMQIPARVSGGGTGLTPVDSGSRAAMLASTPQPGMLGPGTTQSAQSQGSSGTLLSPRQPLAVQRGGMQNPGSKVELNPQPLPPRVQMTNADVIRMFNAGLAESVILQSIQTAAKRFDFSLKSCQALQQAHVTAAVLAAMADGSARPCQQLFGGGGVTPIGNLNPQSASPGTTTAIPDSSMASEFTGSSGSGASWFASSGNYAPKMPPMNSNPKRDATPPADAASKAQIKSKLTAQLASALQRTGHSTGAAFKPTVSNVPEIQALRSQMTFVNSLRTQGALTKGTLVSAQVPNQVVRIQPPATSNPLLHAPQPTKVCMTPQINAVNGKSSGVVFTQDPAYNDYIITGCGFGTQAGQIYLSGAITGGRINLVVKPNQWNDTQIEAMVEPGLTGVLDGWPDLIVVPNGSSPAKFPNCRFYAERQSVLLPSIPQQYATLANVPVGDSTHGFGTKYCPGSDVSHLFPCVAFNAGPPLDGITNGHDHRNDPSQQVSNAVDRDGGQLQFNAGEDVYDLSYMAPGFVVDHATVFWYAWTSDVCEGWASDAFPKKPGDSIGYDTQGHYGWYTKTKTKVVVDWGVDHCAWRWLGIFKVDDWYNSGYSLQVHVLGPIGVHPWTGHPVTTSQNFSQAQPNRVAQARRSVNSTF